MRALGIILLIAGLCGLVYSLNLDTSVGVGDVDMGGFERLLPEGTEDMRVSNLDMMQRQQNYLIVSGLVAFAGLAMAIFGRSGLPPRVPASDLQESGRAAGQTMKCCPDCAELIRAEARLCRFCRREFNDDELRAALLEAEPTAPRSIPCALCGTQLPQTEAKQFDGKHYCRNCYVHVLL